MKPGLKRGEKGFTLIEIIIVLAVLGILAAVVVPNVSGFLGQGKERGWGTDRNTLQASVDSYRTDISKRSGNKWPVSDNTTLGVPTDNTTNGSFADGNDIKAGIIDIKKLSDDKYIRGQDAVKSAMIPSQLNATNSVSGSYVWYISTNGTVESLYWNGTAWVGGFQTDIYP
ncbi:MAG: prepilin-type N-terminal cleavage/methylation domain-containing protein [Chloroflexi bacterium]|nr:prepilin-type N-terminal cleavage/methylation domain-containing protein [Chloroflexota bacterium]